MNANPLEMPLDINARSPKRNAFPSARYFQVHFEYLHELMSDMKKQLDASNQQIALLQQRLSEPMPNVAEEFKQQR